MSSNCYQRSRPSNPWPAVMSAASSGDALIVASTFHPADFCSTPFPLPLERLSATARENVAAVHRAFEVPVPGLSSVSRWEQWTDDDAPCSSVSDPRNKWVSNKANPATTIATGTLASTADSSQSESYSASVRAPSEKQDQRNLSTNERSGDDIFAHTSVLTSTSKPLPVKGKDNDEDKEKEKGTSSTEDVRHAASLRTWACIRAHAAPPSESVDYLCRVRCLPSLIPKILPPPLCSTSSPVSAIAAVLSAFSADRLTLGSTNVEVLYTHIVVPYLRQLQAPASRDMLQAITQLCTRYWRPAVPALYEPFSLPSIAEPSKSNTGGLNAPVAELLARVAQTALPAQAAAQALALFCSPDAVTWPDYAVPLIEALLTHALKAAYNISAAAIVNPIENNSHPQKQHNLESGAGITDILVPALARNVGALEKSVRFGKLLFSLVKDVPEIKTRHQTMMETACSRSKVFLARRALTMLRQSAPVTRDK